MNKLIITVIAAGFLSIIVTIVVGSRLYEGTVVQDPYTTGLMWDASRHSLERSGWQVALATKKISFPSGEFSFTLLGRTGKQVDNAVVELHLTVPYTNRYDRHYQMVQSTEGAYGAKIHVPVRGRWLAHTTIYKENRNAEFDESFEVE